MTIKVWACLTGLQELSQVCHCAGHELCWYHHEDDLCVFHCFCHAVCCPEPVWDPVTLPSQTASARHHVVPSKLQIYRLLRCCLVLQATVYTYSPLQTTDAMAPSDMER